MSPSKYNRSYYAQWNALKRSLRQPKYIPIWILTLSYFALVTVIALSPSYMGNTYTMATLVSAPFFLVGVIYFAWITRKP